MSKYIVVEVPDGWMPNWCMACGDNGCQECDAIKTCGLEKAVEAYEVTGNHIQEYVDGKPVKLYATKGEDK